MLSEREILEIAQNTCVTMLLPEHQEMNAELIWGNRGKFWNERQTLRVRFKNGSSKQQKMAWDRFQKVDSWCGLAFKLVTTGQSEIRVAFNRGSGHWSYVGRDNLSIPQQHQTMNIDLSAWAPAKEWDRVCVHEIFHALGFQHEHQHPLDKTEWDKPAVYQLYSRTQGWSRTEIERQVLNAGSSTGFVGTPEQDGDSIMKYPTDRRLVLDPKYASGWNTQPSKLDLENLLALYP